MVIRARKTAVWSGDRWDVTCVTDRRSVLDYSDGMRTIYGGHILGLPHVLDQLTPSEPEPVYFVLSNTKELLTFQRSAWVAGPDWGF